MKTNWLEIETDKLEAKTLKMITREYNKAFKDLKKEMINDLTEATVDGKLDAMESYKYGKQEAVKKKATKRIKVLDEDVAKHFNTFKNQVYELNYLGTVFNAHVLSEEPLPEGIYTSGLRIKRALERPFTQEALYKLDADTQSQVRANIVGALMRGETPKELAKAIQDTLKTSEERAMRIARTERTGVCNDARQHGAETSKELGIDVVKRWNATLDTKTRDSHQSVDGEIVEIGKKFSNGLLYPGESGAPAKEVVNCRCALVEQIRGMAPSKRASMLGPIEYKTYKEWAKSIN